MKKIVTAILFGILAISLAAGNIGCDDGKATPSKADTPKKDEPKKD